MPIDGHPRPEVIDPSLSHRPSRGPVAPRDAADAASAEQEAADLLAALLL